MSARKGGVDGQPDDLYAQALAARQHAQRLSGQFRAVQLELRQNWQLIQAAWDRAEQTRALWMTARRQPDRLRYSAYARLQARVSSMPVIEQAKGIIMAQCGWPEEQAFDALRRASQRENVKVRELAAAIVARTARAASDQRQAPSLSAIAQSDGEVIPPEAGTLPAKVSRPRHTREAAG
ncbi:MAG TPA: ANTAR domain-containing protein [Chloroflexota bacterium]